MPVPVPLVGGNSTCSIRVSNLPREANEAWLRLVFSPYGTIETLDLAPGPVTGAVVIRFSTPEQASSALKLDGSLTLGSLLRVQLEPQLSLANVALASSSPFNAPLLNGLQPFTPVKASACYNDFGFSPNTPSSPSVGTFSNLAGLNTPATRSGYGDDFPAHKNLYVLNLPLEATTDQLAALFNTHGTVVHCVILAMLDAQARRRGFIDMSTPKEAKEAIETLNGYVWNGYPIEVSYAIVQRSGGPLTGPNVVRRTVPRSRWNCGPRRQPVQDFSPTRGTASRHSSMDMVQTQSDQDTVAMPNSGSFRGLQRQNSSSVCVDPYTIFITGLDPVAILDEEDMANCLQVYGTVVACSLSRDENGMSLGYGVATFAAPSEAMAARDALDGQVQNGVRLTCKNLHFTRSPWTGGVNSGGVGGSLPRPGCLTAPLDPTHDFHQHLPSHLSVASYASAVPSVPPLVGPPDYATAQAALYTNGSSAAPVLSRHVGVGQGAQNSQQSVLGALPADCSAQGNNLPSVPSLATEHPPSPTTQLPPSSLSTSVGMGFPPGYAFASPMDIVVPSTLHRPGADTMEAARGLWGKPVADRGPRKFESAIPRMSFGPIGSSPGKGDILDFTDSRDSSTSGDASTSTSSVNLSGTNGNDENAASINSFGLDTLFLGPSSSQESGGK